MNTERISIRLPDGFDPSRHADALAKLVADQHGAGWDIDHIDPDARTAIATRQVAITEVTAHGGDDTFEIRLAKGTRPTDGDRIATRLEHQYDGYSVTRFEPHLGIATLTRLDPETARCRGAIANALTVKPWDVQIAIRHGGGWTVELPRSYVPSKHDSKLREVAEAIVGRPGWTAQTDPAALTAQIVPGEPPTFPPIIPYPLDGLEQADRHRTPFGMKLPKPGEQTGEDATIDWTSSAWALVAGMPGAGKTVTVNAIIASQLAAGAELVVIDLPAKAIDYHWCKPFCRPGGWGCESLAEAVTALALVHQEGRRRARRLAEAGVVNWVDLPSGQAFHPILVVVDEVTGLLATQKIPAGIPKTHPLVQEALQHNLLAATLDRRINQIVAEMRFVGIRMVLSTQVTNAGTGVGPSLKTKIGHKILQGTNPSETARRQAFADPSAVPTIPDNIRSDPQVSKGVGAAELEAVTPFVYRGWYSTADALRTALDTLGVPTTDQPEPTSHDIARHTPTLDDDQPTSPATHPQTQRHGRHSARGTAPPCTSCNGPIDPATSACRCTR